MYDIETLTYDIFAVTYLFVDTVLLQLLNRPLLRIIFSLQLNVLSIIVLITYFNCVTFIS